MRFEPGALRSVAVRRCLAGALVALLGTCAWQLRPQPPPLAPAGTVTLTVGHHVTSAPIKSVGITHPALAVELAHVHATLAYVGAVTHARAVDDAIRWTSGLHQAEQRRRLHADDHAPTVPATSGAYTGSPRSDACPYAALIRSIWERDADWAISIAWRESRCIPTAYNPSGAEGLFQLLGHGDLMPCDWRDPVCNVTGAWRLYEGSGRAPWAL